MNSPFKRKHLFQTALITGSAFVFLVLAGILNLKVKRPIPVISKQESALNFNRDLLSYVSMGNKRLLTDLIWIQTLIESDLEHYKSNDLNSWMYLRFKTISHLDPKFYENYYWGGQFLSIVKDDLIGAADLLESGLKFYPEDFKLNYFLGFNYYFEMGNYELGIKYLEKIMHYPQAPKFVPNLVLKMKVEMGFNYDSALLLLKANISSATDKHLIEKLNTDFYALKAERDLKCLNKNKLDCDLKDAENNYYIFKNGRYYSQKSFIPYRLKKKGDQKVPFPVNTIK